MKTLDILKMIIDKEMELPPNRCWAYNNAIDLPKDDNIFVVLDIVAKTPYSNITKYKNTEDGLNEVQTINVAEDLTISILSKNTEARERSHEILMALNSMYSQTLQEKYHLHISTISEIFDSSFLEGSAMLNRFDVRITVIRSYEKIKSVDYYDKFSGEIWTENNYNDVLKNEL